jgi:hypothetical protein
MSQTQQRLSQVKVHASRNEPTTKIDLVMADGAAHSLCCTAEDLSALTTALGAAHARMKEGTAVPPLRGVRVTPVYDPHWLVQYEPLTDGSALFFQHPAFGPVAFVIPKRDLQPLSAALLRHANVRDNSGLSDPNRVVN